ncbi:hypothetical protein ScPMuIL_010826 [Solemya velum]
MNPDKNDRLESGVEPASNNPSSRISLETNIESGDGMKRAAAKHMIERYYTQLTDGCGNEHCDNIHCRSSQSFSLEASDRNALAVHALQLFQKKAELCEGQPTKKTRRPVQEQGDNQSVQSLSLLVPEEKPSTSNFSPVTEVKQIQSAANDVKFLTEDKLVKIIEQCKKDSDWSKLIKIIGAVYNNPESLVLSFRKKDDVTLPKEYRRAMEEDVDKDKDENETEMEEDSKFPIQESESMDNNDSTTIDELSRDLSRELQCPVQDTEGVVSPHDKHVTVDIPSVRRAYAALMEIPDLPFQGALINALLYLSRNVELEIRYQKPLQYDNNYLNIFIIVMEIPLLHSPEFIDNAFPEFCKTLGSLPVHGQAKLAAVWSTYGTEKLQKMVQSLQQLITVKIINDESRWGRGYYVNDVGAITGATKVLKILYYASLFGSERDPSDIVAEEKEINETEDNLHELLQGAVGHEPKELKQPKEDPLAKEMKITPVDYRKPLVAYEDFINEPLNDYLEIDVDYKYRIDSEDKFSFTDYSFIMTTASKHMSMYFDNRVRMFNERRTSILQTLVHGLPPMPFLRLRVRRDHVIDDALVALEMVAMENPPDLKKQLFVEFDGEQGLDEGGVSKEFFQLVVDEIFNPDFGMFTYSEQTHQFWFNPMSFENDGQFTLIGIVLGLAIYNSTIVNVRLPSVVYRKLMGKKGTFQDLKDVDPTLASSLQQMLDYEGDDLEETFMQTFSVSQVDVFGTTINHMLKDKGDHIPVTNDNRKEFVSLYADYILNKAVQKQFRAFKRGFDLVSNESPLRLLFRPDEIELLVCGSEHFDFNALEETTEYDGGFTVDSPVIRHFWEILHDFPEEQKRQWLQFTTGSDRVPIGGLSKLKLIITRNGPDSDRLPTAHTCFNVLLLPDYCSKEKLRERLLKAITYSKGFGML